MSKSFELVDHKVAEADFFIEKLCEAGLDLFSARCYFNAFVSASRSITFSLQAVMKDISGFNDWYQEVQDSLQNNQLARFFVRARNVTQKVGGHPVNGGYVKAHDGSSSLVFTSSQEFPHVPSQDVASACKDYLSFLVDIILVCYEKFGKIIDPEMYYTEEAFAERGLTIDDADEEAFGFRGWTQAPDVPTEARWQMIRDYMTGCEIDHLFEKYTKRNRPKPSRAPEKPSSTEVWFPENLRKTGDDMDDLRQFIDSLKKSKKTQ